MILDARPLAALSRLLSAIEPRNKWPGFTQSPLSQRWSTHDPSGMLPNSSVHATRWAAWPLKPSQTPPYLTAPPLRGPSHGQHSESSPIAARFQNRSTSGRRVVITGDFRHKQGFIVF